MFIRKKKYKQLKQDLDIASRDAIDLYTNRNNLRSQLARLRSDNYEKYNSALKDVGCNLGAISNYRIKEFVKKEYNNLIKDDENNDTLFFLGQYDDFDTIQAATALLTTAKLFDDYLKANNLTIRKK